MGRIARHAAVGALSLVVVATPAAVAAGGGVQPNGTPATPPTFHEHHGAVWHVGVPALGISTKHNYPIRAQCSARDIDATASTRRTSDGAIGTVVLKGTHRCAPVVTSGPRRLLGADGHRLPVPVAPQAVRVNPVSAYRVPYGYRTVVWSFAWRGSWCGSAATSVVLPRSRGPFGGLRVRHGHHLHATPRLVVPLTGPHPRCHGASDASLSPGVAGFPRSPIQTPPASWSRLHATLHVPTPAPYALVGGLSVTLSNPTDAAIPLSPCPDYRLMLQRDGGKVSAFPDRSLACGATPATVPAHGRLNIALHGNTGGYARPGEHLAYQFGLAGVPTATAGIDVDTTAAPTLDPSHGGADSSWAVAYPATGAFSYPPPPRYKRCAVDAITATAETRPTPDGVAGLVRLRGEECKLPLRKGPQRLLAGDATLDVRTIPVKQQTHPLFLFPPTALLVGRANWSFTWDGSWCGSDATAVQLPIDPSASDPEPGVLSVPLTGPSPECHGTSDSVLRPGGAGFPGDPSIAPSPSWQALTTTLNLPDVIRGYYLRHASVTLQNPTDAPITLAPCPTYELNLRDRYGDGGGVTPVGAAGDHLEDLDCHDQPRVVAAGGSVTIPLPRSDIYRQDLRPDGQPVHFTFDVTGMPQATADARLAARPAPDPSHGGRDVQWRVAAPALFGVSGPGRVRRRACKPRQVSVDAQTRPGPAGVVGLVHVHGRHCSLHVAESPSGFLDGEGHPLQVKIRGTPADLRGSTVRPDLDRNAGDAYWGYAWRGSWCGPFAISVQVRLRGGAVVTGPVDGHSPTCDVHSTAVVHRGLVGGSGQAVQTPPPAWRGLRATLSVPDVPHGSDTIHPTVSLSNQTAHRITLAPCPSYVMSATGPHAAQTVDNGYGVSFPCPGKPLVVRPHRTVAVALHEGTINRSALAPHGGEITVEFAIAGVPPARTTTHVDP